MPLNAVIIISSKELWCALVRCVLSSRLSYYTVCIERMSIGVLLFFFLKVFCLKYGQETGGLIATIEVTM